METSAVTFGGRIRRCYIWRRIRVYDSATTDRPTVTVRSATSMNDQVQVSSTRRRRCHSGWPRPAGASSSSVHPSHRADSRRSPPQCPDTALWTARSFQSRNRRDSSLFHRSNYTNITSSSAAAGPDTLPGRDGQEVT